MTRYAYAAWDGIHDSASPSPTALLAALTNDLLQSGELEKALRAFVHRDETSRD
jgi:hypothetical protein